MGDRTATQRRKVGEVSTLGVGVLLVTLLLGIVNYLGWKYHKRFDWTSSEIYSLSEKTENVLAALEHDVDVIVYMQSGDQLYGPAMELLARYEAASPRLTVREVDPTRNLAEAQQLVDQFAIDAIDVILFESNGERRLVQSSDLAEYDYSGLQQGIGPQMTDFKGEQRFTSSLIELSEPTRPRVVFTAGHGELQLSDFSPDGLSAAQELLERDNFEVETWESLGQSEVPDGVQLVVVAGPTGNFLEPEIEALRGFLSGGGRLLVMLDPTLSRTGDGLVDTGLSALVSEYGVSVGEDIVVDPANPLPFFGADTIFTSSYGRHPITRSLSQAELPTILSLARSVGMEDGVEGYDAEELILTSAEGWGETNLADLSAVQLDDQDLVGPVSLGVALSVAEVVDELMGEEGTSGEDSGEPAPSVPSKPGERLVVIGDATFATNAQLQNVGNLTLLANTLNWLAEREALVAIPPKTPESVRLSLSQAEVRGIFWFSVLGLPALVIGAGILVHRRRRS